MKVTKVEASVDGLLEHLCVQMELLNDGKISIEQAKAQANLVKQANNIYRYKLDVEKFKAKNGNA